MLLTEESAAAASAEALATAGVEGMDEVRGFSILAETAVRADPSAEADLVMVITPVEVGEVTAA